jgi:hypothetical protein
VVLEKDGDQLDRSCEKEEDESELLHHTKEHQEIGLHSDLSVQPLANPKTFKDKSDVICQL